MPISRSRLIVSRIAPYAGCSSNSTAAVPGLYGPIRQYRSPHRSIIAWALDRSTV